MFDANRTLVNSIENLNDEQKEYLYSALNIHGHACGGMPMGYVAGLAAMKALGMDSRERNMDTIAVVYAGNGHAAGCFVDGVQFSTGCTFGKGIMKKEAKGKWQFMLIQKKTGKAVKARIRNEILDKAFSAPFITEYRARGVNPADIPEEIAGPGFTRLFGLPPEDVVEIEGPFTVDVPGARPCFNRVSCSVCGATVAENYICLEDGKPVCRDCTHYAG
ncbi:MAG: formylmethanofuran dehydrogenase [Acidobacteria bacterium]|nr:formylmethanofuran dehydrogenase [Acidobacteriota bacterium]